MSTTEQVELNGSSRPPRRGSHRLLALLLLALVSVGMVVYSFPKLKSLSSAKSEHDDPEVLFHLAYTPPRIHNVPASADAAEEFEAFRQTQAVLIRHRALIEKAIASSASGDVEQQWGLDPSALPKWIEDRLQVDFPATQILRVRLRGAPQREVAVSLLNALADEYLTHRDEWR